MDDNNFNVYGCIFRDGFNSSIVVEAASKPEVLIAYLGQYGNTDFNMDQGLTDIGLLLEPINMEKFDFIRLEKKEQWVAAKLMASSVLAWKRRQPFILTATKFIEHMKTELTMDRNKTMP